jgi:hypothetical protein
MGCLHGLRFTDWEQGGGALMTVKDLLGILEGLDPDTEVVTSGGEFPGYYVAGGAWAVTVCRSPWAERHFSEGAGLIDPATREDVMGFESETTYDPPRIRTLQSPEPRVVLLVGSVWEIPKEDADRMIAETRSADS